MALLQRLRQRLDGDDGETERHRYQCLGCGEAFRSTAPTTNQASCPACGATRVRQARRRAQ